MTTRSHVDVDSPYHGTPTCEVLADLEHYRYLHAGITADLEACPESWDHPEQTLAFIRFHITEATAELERREQLKDRPEAPPWPEHHRTPRVDLDDLKRRLSVPDWLESRGVVLLPFGRGWRARCPFPDHEDRTPSFSVSSCGRLWKCHGCQRGGDLVTLKMQLDGETDFRRAIEDLVRDARVLEMLAEVAP